MIFFSLLLFVFIILTLGWSVLLFWPQADRRPALALSFILGGGLITWQLFIIRFVLHWNLGAWCLYLVASEIVLLFYYHYQRGALTLPRLFNCKTFSNLDYSLLFLLAWSLGLALLRALTHPLVAFDALAVWAYRVKILYYQQADLFNHASLAFWSSLAKPNYPWHLSLLGWLQAELSAGVNDTLINFLPWCYYLCLLLFVYALAKSYLSRTWSLSLTLGVATMPLIFYHSYNFYADLPLAAYLAGIALLWRRWLKRPSLATCSLLALIAGLSLTVKSEAVFFIAPLCFLMVLKIVLEKKGLRQLWPLLLVIAVYLPWGLWLLTHRLSLSNIAPGLAWHPEVSGKILTSLFMAQNWHLWWYFLLIMLVFSQSVYRRSVFRYSLAWFVLALSAFLGLYYFTETYRYALDDTAISRNLILFIPLSLVLLVDCLSAWFNEV